MRITLAPRRLIGRVALLIIGIALVQFAATILLYDRISRDSVREDHARRVAELLEVSERLNAKGERGLAEIMSTDHLRVWVTTTPAVRKDVADPAALQIAQEVRQWEHRLSKAELHMDVARSGGRDHLVGSMRLRDGRWLNFRSADLSTAWPVIASATLITLLLTATCILFAVSALRQLGAPLRRLTEATNRIGDGKRVTLEEAGPSDLRNLSRAYNGMQDRITRMVSDQTKAFVAISHDLRTPLARLKVSADFIKPKDMRELVTGNVAEMEAMIASLQTFLNAQQFTDQLERVNLKLLVAEVAHRWEGRVTLLPYAGDARIETYPQVLRLALAPLIENAVQYGERAEIAIGHDAEGICIRITDRGPGISAEHLPELIEPFFRVDAARARDTPGFGLGIPTAHRLLQRFGGSLSFDLGAGGGLKVTVRPPACRT